MKKIFSVAILVMAIGGAVNLYMANTNKSVLPVYSSNIVALTTEGCPCNCWWKNATCADGVTHYESCIVSGNGLSCVCGSVTRNCP